jgi:hypothetical protein
LLLAVGVGWLVITQPSLSNAGGSWLIDDRVRGAAAGAEEQPLHAAVIDRAVRNALQPARTSDEMALASASPLCHHVLRSDPNLLQLDR